MKIISIARQEREDETFRTSRARADGTAETVEIELEVMRPFTCVAIAIAATDGNNTVGYGQVQKVKLDGKTMKDGVQTDNERVQEVVLTVTWFKRTGEGFHLTESLPSEDNLHHPMSTYLGNVDFAFDPATLLYTFRYWSFTSYCRIYPTASMASSLAPLLPTFRPTFNLSFLPTFRTSPITSFCSRFLPFDLPSVLPFSVFYVLTFLYASFHVTRH